MIINPESKLKNQIVLAILGFLGALTIIYLVNQYGAGINPDSAYYISIARNITNNSGFIGYDGNAVVLQPPLYPILLSLIQIILHVDPLVSSGYLNAILFGFIIYFSGLFLLKSLYSEALFFLGTVIVFVSYILVGTSLMALSESLFIFLSILFLIFLNNYIEKNSISSLMFLSFCAAFSALTRYIGITFIICGSICILIWSKTSQKERFKHLYIFIFLSSSPIIIWMIRNYILSGTLFGPRGASSYSLAENLNFYITTIYPWFLPKNLYGYLFVILFILLIVLISIESKLLRKINRDTTQLPGPVLLFVIIYSILLLLSSTLTAYDPISTRLLSPIYIPSIFILFIIVDKIIEWSGKYFNRLILTFIAAYCILIFFRYPFEGTRTIIKQYYQTAGFQYGSQYWKESETINFLKKHNYLKSKYRFYSNAPEAVYILSNIRTHWSPGRTMYNSPTLLDTNSIFRNIWKKGENICLVWFKNLDRNFLLPVTQLKKENKMENVAHFNDGDIFIFIKE